MTALRKNISKLLAKTSLSVTQLEKQAGLSRYSVQNIMQGKSTKPSADTVALIAKHFGCTVEQLLSEDMLALQISTIKPILFNEHNLKIGKNSIFALDLYQETFNTINNYIAMHKIVVHFWEVIVGITEIYQYSYENNNKKLDLRFAEWWLKRNFINMEH